MTDKKFTDEEIIQALECHVNAEDCVSCGIRGWCEKILLTELVLDLINRQKAEIEELKEKFTLDFEKMESEYDGKIKAEAYKEFAKFLIDKASKGLIHVSDLPDFVIEMVGGKE